MELRGCPTPGACSALAEIARLTGERDETAITAIRLIGHCSKRVEESEAALASERIARLTAEAEITRLAEQVERHLKVTLAQAVRRAEAEKKLAEERAARLAAEGDRDIALDGCNTAMAALARVREAAGDALEWLRVEHEHAVREDSVGNLIYGSCTETACVDAPTIIAALAAALASPGGTTGEEGKAVKPDDVDVWCAADYQGGSPGIYAGDVPGDRWVATFKRKADRDYVLSLLATGADA